MPRPRKCRRVCAMPQIRHFGPLDGTDVPGVVRMTVDEYETLRLIDLAGYTQEECAAQMGVARTTVQGVYNEARRKTAEALVYGRALLIDGGDYDLCQGTQAPCGRKCRKMCCRKDEKINNEEMENNE
ncbi:DUF134 domain-containing protein [Anaerotignum lactatifermentans]|uniref:UPF0251 protein H9X83_06420 n=1 Tax=Anaerotignum lactatifermentans TaxID=160404 RepID=A0ABS2GAP4_9FIRM|nr:DUF134 domain-containing protein [Anaerotignum lactatifermentans]MBM6829437.1 DUF134 domain-containing protein [Anaerotignum lactatifermentans]MBM6877795.1 DUF134 domain-containing protein [Anaerotignum lactatifermentans]MBM6951014.1 DUF134 domain-containing protein [Anaerotignum lactatifermentans]